MIGHLTELDGVDPSKVSVGDTVYFVKKVTGDVIETELVEYLTGSSPRIATKWRTGYKFTVLLQRNSIVFDTGKPEAKRVYKNWWKVWEPQAVALMEAFRDKRKR